jgi:hypothetical protein
MSILRKYIKSGVSNSILALLVILVLLAELLWWLHQCSRNRLSLASRLAWDLRLIAYRPINRFYRSTIYRPFFLEILSFGTKSSKICYAKNNIGVLDKSVTFSLHLNWQKWQNSSYCTLLLPSFGFNRCQQTGWVATECVVEMWTDGVQE